MKRLTKLLLILVLIFSLHITLYTLHSYAAVPHLINYQGRLTDASGTPLNGSYALTFRIYDAESAGNLLWEETQAGTLIQKGIFSILLGSVTALNLPFDKQYFLEIKVNNEVMSPRQRITSAGYALRAEEAEKALNADKFNNQLPSYYLAHSNLSGLSNNDHPQYVRGKSGNYRIDNGSVFVPGDSWAAINFSFTFLAPPIVIISRVANVGSSSNEGNGVFDITTTGCKISTTRDAGETFNWIAIGSTI